MNSCTEQSYANFQIIPNLIIWLLDFVTYKTPVCPFNFCLTRKFCLLWYQGVRPLNTRCYKWNPFRQNYYFLSGPAVVFLRCHTLTSIFSKRVCSIALIIYIAMKKEIKVVAVTNLTNNIFMGLSARIAICAEYMSTAF